MASSTSIHVSPETAAAVRTQTLLTWSLAAGALLWLVTLQAHYVLAYAVCDGRSRWPLHAVTVVTAGLSVACALWAWRHRRHQTTDEGAGAGDTAINWTATASVIANLWFALVIAAHEVIIAGLAQCT